MRRVLASLTRRVGMRKDTDVGRRTRRNWQPPAWGTSFALSLLPRLLIQANSHASYDLNSCPCLGAAVVNGLIYRFDRRRDVHDCDRQLVRMPQASIVRDGDRHCVHAIIRIHIDQPLPRPPALSLDSLQQA